MSNQSSVCAPGGLDHKIGAADQRCCQNKPVTEAVRKFFAPGL